MEHILSFILGYLLCFGHDALYNFRKSGKRSDDAQSQWQKLLEFTVKGGEKN